MADQWLDKLDWADRDQDAAEYSAQLAQFGADWGPFVRERAEEIGRDAALAEVLKACGL